MGKDSMKEDDVDGVCTGGDGTASGEGQVSNWGQKIFLWQTSFKITNIKIQLLADSIEML